MKHHGELQKVKLARNKNSVRMMSVQNPYSLLNRTYEIGLAEISIREKIGLLAYSPLASGYLTGKYRIISYQKTQEQSEIAIFGQDILLIRQKLLMHTLKFRKNII